MGLNVFMAAKKVKKEKPEGQSPKRSRKAEIEEEKVDEKKLNLFEHELVPSHRILNDEETQALLSKYKITKIMLPKISNKDPCSKSIKAKPGDIIEILRRSVTAGEAKYYRVVVQD